MKHHISIDSETLAVLKECTMTADRVALPPRQLARPLYDKVNKVLATAGGKWNKSAKAHVFPEDPREILSEVMGGGVIKDVKKATQAFYTPPDLARRVALYASVEGKVVLEPSAGCGALADNAWLCDAKTVLCVEQDPKSCDVLRKKGYDVEEADFMEWSPKKPVDRVVMNPPFTGGQDIEHVTRAYGMLKPGGRLVAVTSPGWQHNQSKKAEAFRQLVKKRGRVEEVPAGTFKESGTNIATLIVILDAPPQATPKRPKNTFALPALNKLKHAK